MNTELLDRLILDRALGQLSPDVEAMLMEVLTENPEAARQAAKYHETLALVTGTLKRQAPVAAHDLPPCVAPPVNSIGHWWSLAASFALGAGVAALMWPSREAPRDAMRTPGVTPPMVRAVSEVPQDPSPALAREVRSLPFWSTRRAYLLAAAARQINPQPANTP